MSERAEKHPPVLIKNIARVDLLALHRLNPARYPFYLASSAMATSQNGRYDILFACPQARIDLRQDFTVHAEGVSLIGQGFLESFANWWQADKQPADVETSAHGLPFRGGWFLYLGYELVNEIEPTLQLKPDRHSSLPVARATRIPAAIILDHVSNETFLVVESDYADVLRLIEEDIAHVSVTSTPWSANISMAEEAPQHYLDAVARVHEYIRDGDVFQVNLSRLWQGTRPNELSAATAFEKLAHSNPAPFAGMACFDETTAVISSSPERLVRSISDCVETRPIAGTRPRGSDQIDDEGMQTELLAHPKERAEHIMLIDLERNDLGRICIPGTVEVNEMMVLESYAHVHHIVSNVRGRLQADITPSDIIHAVFPGGTITGCPKIRCMEIINELESGARGAYTGSMGYVNRDGDMDLNILIRTIVLEHDVISVRAGAGLVADSIAENELNETRAKARGMLNSLRSATDNRVEQ